MLFSRPQFIDLINLLYHLYVWSSFYSRALHLIFYCTALINLIFDSGGVTIALKLWLDVEKGHFIIGTQTHTHPNTSRSVIFTRTVVSWKWFRIKAESPGHHHEHSFHSVTCILWCLSAFIHNYNVTMNVSSLSWRIYATSVCAWWI